MMISMTSTLRTWFWIPKPSPDAHVRLVCHPPAGSDGTIFGDWAEALFPEIELRAVRMPGRGPRLDETPIRDAQELAAKLTQALCSEPASAIAVFGGSLGGLVAFEVAHRLVARGRTPIALFVFGTPAPHLLRRPEGMPKLAEPEFRQQLAQSSLLPPDVLADEELLDLVMPTLRADYAMAGNYRSSARCRLQVPIHAFVGIDDPVVSVEEVAPWRLHADGNFTISPLPGGHLWNEEQATNDLLLKAIRAHCSMVDRRT